MRIVSLLPALSELVAALGHAGELVGISHECDYPPEITRVPRLIDQPIEFNGTCAEIDAQVAHSTDDLFRLHSRAFENAQPDLILTQDQCAVCAVPASSVDTLAAGLPWRPRILAVNPIDLAGVHEMFAEVANALGGDAPARAEAIVRAFHDTSATIQDRLVDVPRPRVLFLEWPDPPFSAGHWIPELIERAGGTCVLGTAGGRSVRVTWDEISASDPDVAIVAPCGFSHERAVDEARRLRSQPVWTHLPAVRACRVAIADGNAYFSRPGPRLEASLRILAAVIHPDHCSDLAETIEGWSRLPVHPRGPES